MDAELIKKIIAGEVVVDEATIDSHSHDASIFAVKPEMVAYPKSVDDLKKLVSLVSEHKKAGEDISLTARAAGTCMSGGSLTDSISVDFTKYFTKIGEVANNAVGQKTIAVEPGVYFRDLEKVLDGQNLLFPPFPASKKLCALGGMVANNAAGEKTLSQGQTKDYVVSLDVVLADGELYHFQPLNKFELAQKVAQKDFEGDIYRQVFDLMNNNQALINKTKPIVSKNSTGYNLWEVWDENKKIFNIAKLIIGAQGTLGWIANINLLLAPKKPYSRFAVIFLPDLEKLVPIVNTVLGFAPEAFECYDNYTFDLAVQSLTYEVKVLADAWQPLLKMLQDKMPQLVLLVQLSDVDEHQLEEKFAHLIDEVSKYDVPFRVIGSSLEGEKYWNIRHESFNLLRHRGASKDGGKSWQAAPFIDDIIVRPEHLKEFLPELEAILKKYEDKILYTIAGHIGDGNFHIIPLVDFTDPETPTVIGKVMDEVFALVWRFGGSMSAEHNDGLIRSQYLVKQYGPEMYRLFEQVKNIFDPLNIFNPRKKVGVDQQFAFDHIKKTNRPAW